MNKFQIRSFFNQFTFLATGEQPFVSDVNEVEQVEVSRITPELLEKTPQFDGGTGSLVNIADSERVYLLDQDGGLLVEVKQGGSCTHSEAHTDDERWEGETIGEALLRLEDPDQVAYALRIRTGYEIRDHHSVGGYSVTLYKSPRGFTLKGWVEEQMRRASIRLAASIAEIDAEGVVS